MLNDGDHEAAAWAFDSICKYAGNNIIIPEERVFIPLTSIYHEDELPPVPDEFSDRVTEYRTVFGHCDAWFVGDEYDANDRLVEGGRMLHVADLKAGIHKHEYYLQLSGYALSKMIELGVSTCMLRVLYYDQRIVRSMFVTKSIAIQMARSALDNRLRPNPQLKPNYACQYCANILNCDAIEDSLRELVNWDRSKSELNHENVDRLYYLAGVAEKVKVRAAEYIKSNALSEPTQSMYRVSTVKGRRSINKSKFISYCESLGIKLRDIIDCMEVDSELAQQLIEQKLLIQNAMNPEGEFSTELPDEVYDVKDSTVKITPNKKYNPLAINNT